MYIYIAAERIDLATPVESRFQAIEPEDAMGDAGVGKALPSVTDRLAGGKDGADGIAGADLESDPVQTERGLVRVGGLTSAKSRSRDHKTAVQGDLSGSREG